ncbi:DUF397 domain-containing protein [Streptomyces zingiberis]|uniref:DUF397 domain-containing protein n=1 Tax=Streptomyces zingiberis TaxID=2053010 RepID=A0ABX1BTK6_9ACTN|nr:DUF397 domain-containing protein [Streptomyces zingiberis]NJP99884.1 DUF397 domain-containing protein [Streptomyces zingiberis]
MKCRPTCRTPRCWTKSSHSTNDGPECVEAAIALGAVFVRDSKLPHGPRLAVTPVAWERFTAYAAEG